MDEEIKEEELKEEVVQNESTESNGDEPFVPDVMGQLLDVDEIDHGEEVDEPMQTADINEEPKPEEVKEETSPTVLEMPAPEAEKTDIETTEKVGKDAEFGINPDIKMSPERRKEIDLLTKELNNAIKSNLPEEQIQKLKDEIIRKSGEAAAEEAEIDWDKIEFEDEEKLIPVFTEDDRQVFDICTSPIIYEGMAGKWSEMARNDILDYKEYLKNKEAGIEDDDGEYQKSVENSAKAGKELLALLQQESRRMADEYKKNKIAEHGIKDVVTSIFGKFIKDKFRFTYDLQAASQKEVKDSTKFFDSYTKYLSDQSKKYTFTPVIFDCYTKKNFLRYDYLNPEYFTRQIDNIVSAIRIGASILGVENTTTEVNDKGERFTVKKKEPMNIGAFIRGTLEECNFSISAIMYAFILYGDEKYAVVKKSFEKAVGSNDFSTIEKVVGLEGYYDQINSPKHSGPFYNLFNAVVKLMDQLKKPEIIGKLDKLYTDMMLNNDVFLKIAKMDDSGVEFEFENAELKNFTIKNDEKFISVLSQNYPVVEGKHLGDFPKYYVLTLLHARYLTVHELKRLLDAYANAPEDEAAKKVFEESINNISFQLAMRFISDENKFTYSEFISDIYDYCKESYDINKLDKNFIFGRILGYADMGYELGYKIGFDTTNAANGHGLYEHASKTLQKKYTELVVEEEDDFLLKDVNLIDVHEKFVNIVVSIANQLTMHLMSEVLVNFVSNDGNGYSAKFGYAINNDDFKNTEGFELPKWFAEKHLEILKNIEIKKETEPVKE